MGCGCCPGCPASGLTASLGLSGPSAALKQPTTTTTNTMTTATMETNHAEANAKAWMEEISNAYEACQFCTEGGEGRDLSREVKALLHEHKYNWDNSDEVAEAITEQMRNRALSVSVRSQWQTPGFEPLPGDFQILLTTGGPALRVMGELDEDHTASRFWIEHQDWGTPWTQWLDVDAIDAYALDWFVGLFWFGE